MISELEKQLRLDGQLIQQQAQARLTDWEFNQASLDSPVIKTSFNGKPAWWFGLAAAIGLTVMIWSINSNDSIQPNQPIHLSQKTTTDVFNFKQLHLSLEQKANQLLIDEQQAMIEDLKALKVQLLSI